MYEVYSLPLKVLHVFKLYLPDLHGGIQEVIRQICHVTGSRHGVTNRVLTVAQGPGAREIQLPENLVVRCPMTLDAASTPISLDMIGEFKRQLRWADVIHYHFPWPFAELLHLLYGRKTVSVVTYHSDIIKQRFLKVFYNPVMRSFLRNVDRIVPTSENYLRTSSDLAPFRDRCRVIPIGLDEENYAQPVPEAVEGWRRQVGSDFFLFIGILRYYKGLDILLEAARNAPFTVVIAGTGPLENKLRKKAEQLGLTNVHFVGYVAEHDKAALFSLARAVVFPSIFRSEAFGVSLLEGAMYGLPLISTEIGTGTTYVNKKDLTGLVVPPGDAPALRSAMDLLYRRKEMCETFGRNARVRFETHFTAEQMGIRYFKLYREVTGNSRSEVSR